MKIATIVIAMLSLSGMVAATQEPVSSTPPAVSASPEIKPKKAAYLFDNMSGWGGSFMVHYGNGSTMNDTMSFGLRGFVHFGQALRLGALGNLTTRTNFSSSMRDTAGSVGIFGEYLFRFDPFIIGLGLKAGGGAYGSSDPAAYSSGTKYAYFNAMPFAEIEFRLLESASVSIYGGYDYFTGNSSSPSISQGIVGLAVTYSKY